MDNGHFFALAIFSDFSHFCLLFLTKSKSVLHEKCWSSQMIKVCKKIPLFKIKNGFLAIFVILAKTRKWPKIHFFFKVEIFFSTQNSVGETKFFQFLHFLFGQKKWVKMENGHFFARAIFSAFSHFCLLFLTESKSVLHEKCWSSQMIKVCQKIQLFKIKKWFFGHFCDFGQNRKKGTFAHGPFFPFLAQKCQKYQFSSKNLFLRIFLWVISDRKGFLYF